MTLEEAKECKENKTPVNVTYGTLTFYGGVIKRIRYETDQRNHTVRAVVEVVDRQCTYHTLPQMVSVAK